jgi:hypothetical protein
MTDKSPLMNIKKRKTEIRKRIEREKKGGKLMSNIVHRISCSVGRQGRTEPNQMKWKYSAKGCHPSALNVVGNRAQGNKFAPFARNRLGGVLVYTPDLIQEAKN